MQANPKSQCSDVTAILLAGGSSRRFGPNNKLLATRNGKSLIHHALDSIARSQIQRLIVVLGHDASALEKHCIDYVCNTVEPTSIDIEFLINSDYESGMASSLRTGISSLLNRNIKQTELPAHAALVCLADMPDVKPQTINALISAMTDTRTSKVPNADREAAAAFIPTYEKSRGNPVLLMPELLNLTLNIAGDVGARYLLQTNPNAIYEVPVDDAGIFTDCDTPEQLAR